MKKLWFISALSIMTTLATAQTTTPQSATDTDTFTEDFSATQLPPGWVTIKSPGSSVTVRDGELRIRNIENGQAHIQRELKRDNITVTARTNFDSSVYLVWNEDTWIGLGKLSPTPFGRFYTAITRDSKTSVTQHRGTNYGGSHLLRMELGKDHISFSYSNTDKTEWRHLRTIERKGAFTVPPKLISFGTRYTDTPGPYGDPNAVADKTSDKDMGETSLDDIEIKPTAPDDMLLTEEQRHEIHNPKPEPVAALLKKSDDDPTFEQVASYYPAMNSPREIVGVPAHPLDIGVDWLGRLDKSPWGGEVAWLEFGDEGKPFAENRKDIKSRALLDGWIPVVTLTKEHSGVESKLTITGWSENFSPDADLYAFVHLKMTVNQGVHLPQKIALAGKDDERVEWEPKPVNRRELDFYFKFKHPEPETAVEITREEFNKIKNEVADMWRKRLANTSIITTPDKRVNNMYKAMICYSMLNADMVDGYLEPHDGSGFYDIAFGHSVSLAAIAADIYGMPEYTKQIHDMQLHHQKPNGSYVQECGLTDLGSMLFAMAHHYEITHDKEWLQRVTPNIMKGYTWIADNRTTTSTDKKTKGLIKFRPYNDYPQPTFNYVGNFLCCAGLEDCSEALAAIGKQAEADKLAAEAKAYRADIYASMEASLIKRNGITMLPIEPDTQRILKLSDYTGGAYYGLTASMTMDTGFFRKGDKHQEYLINMLEHGGLIAGVCEFQEGIDHAYTYGYLTEQLKRHNPRKVILAFWSMLAYGTTRDTWSPVEISMIKTGENHYTLPHTFSCTSQLRLLRNMLLREDRDALIIGQAIPRQWLKPGKETKMESAPTTFGPASFSMKATDDNTIQIQLTPPSRNPPKEIRLHVRHPSQKPITSATTDSDEKLNFEGEIITLPGNTKSQTITVKF